MTRSWPWSGSSSPPPLVLALLRHGRTAWNAERRFLGRSDVGLDPVGHAEAAALAGAIPDRYEALYASPSRRAVQTASYLRGRTELDEALLELDQGDLEGLTAEDARGVHAGFFERFAADPATTVVPGGECLGDVQQRAMAFVAEIPRRHPTGVVLAVTHQMVIASILCAIQDQTLGDWRRYRMANASLTSLLWTNGRWVLGDIGWRPDAGGAGARAG